MKKKVLTVILGLSTLMTSYGQEWMTSLDVAKRLALVQDKMIFMMWEEATTYPFPVKFINENGKRVLIRNLFENEELNQVIWEHFVPVLVNEASYNDLYEAIKDKRSQSYLDKFSDDSIKIMDINGTIINTDIIYDEYLNLSTFIYKYYMNTSFLKAELENYSKEQNFTTSFRLAVKYIDAAIVVNKEVRPEIIDVSNIYLDEASTKLTNEAVDNKTALYQKIEFYKLMQELVLGNSRRVLRKLKKIEPSEIHEINQSLIDLLYFTAHIMQKDETNASVWRSKLSLVNLNKASQIININR